MRIAYVISWRGGQRTGPFKKMAGQAAAWAASGHDVAMFVITSAEARQDWESLPYVQHLEVGKGGGAALRARKRSAHAVEVWNPDVIYLRHGLTTPGLPRLVRRFPTVLEINGDEVAVAAARSALKALWARATRGTVLRDARAAVFMTGELAHSPRFARYRLPSVVIPNGIDLSAIPSLPPSTATQTRLVMLGHPSSPWHGTDKLAGLARRHPDWHIDVIGPSVADLGGTPPPNLVLYGELDAADYLPLLARAHAAFGSLAMHRLGANENPALKVREYLALGLPVISGCVDPDFPGGSDFLLVLPNTEHNIDESDRLIVEFLARWKDIRVPRAAIEHLDTRHKERVRLAVMADAVGT